MNVKDVSSAVLTGRAAACQHIAAADYTELQLVRDNNPWLASILQAFHAQSSAMAREALFELIERNGE